MNTPFDRVITEIAQLGYHNHRLEGHSDIVSKGIVEDLQRHCTEIREDLGASRVHSWLNFHAPGARGRKIDLFIGERQAGSARPDLTTLRIGAEHKSVITAHRNRDSRFDDLNETMKVIHGAKQEAVVIATVLVGVAPNVLNVPDQVKKFFRSRPGEFERLVVPRLSSGDQSLWDEFGWAVSRNRPNDAAQTVAKFRMLPTRQPGHTHVQGYDYVLIVPVHIDNVNPPRIEVNNALGIDVEADYEQMLETICKAYRARWHL